MKPALNCTSAEADRRRSIAHIQVALFRAAATAMPTQLGSMWLSVCSKGPSLKQGWGTLVLNPTSSLPLVPVPFSEPQWDDGGLWSLAAVTIRPAVSDTTVSSLPKLELRFQQRSLSVTITIQVSQTKSSNKEMSAQGNGRERLGSKTTHDLAN